MSDQYPPPATSPRKSDALDPAERIYLCQSFGLYCVRCHHKLYGNAPRVCPTVTDTETVHEIARKLHRDG